MGSGGSKKLRSISVTRINDLKTAPAQPTRSKSVPSNLGSIKTQHSSNKKLDNNDPRSQTNGKLPVSESGSVQAMSVQNPSQLPKKVDADGTLVTNTLEWTVTELYNVIVAESWLAQPEIHNPMYLLLVDCRTAEEYAKSHIITAKHHSSLNTEFGCLLSVPSQLQEYDMIVLYDDIDGSICSALDAKNISYFKLHGSFGLFQTKYHFLCTNKVVSTKEQRAYETRTWPSEILEDCLYQAAADHATDEKIIKILGITHIVNVTLDQPNSFPDTVKYMTIRLDDKSMVDLGSWIPKTSQFIYEAIDNPLVSDKKNKNKVLVHCNMGRSRSSTIVLGYLMQKLNWSLKDASEWLKDCRSTAKPNNGFLDQLLIHERTVFGRKLTDFKDLPF
uniref:Probable rhodanese domain-containing dual specificity protein phosphatase n=1 Tax=Phallusia mammillata TaxID=59560 RepID=A0A6F9DAV8_9ASCI|nr:probable rhodanese domain-containing dual specificity protein phosphatase [Phallusia mammillata]